MNTTLLFPIRRTDGKITEVCLAMKKRSFGKGRWNGVGGKVLPGESIESAALRETTEEIGILVQEYKKVAELDFSFKFKPEWNQVTHVYLIESWDGEPIESEEMRPQWYTLDSIPFENMWPDDTFWLPKVLDGEMIKAKFVFGENDAVLEKEVNSVETV
jgi:8-oxo-dGTP pyrophosphatase MutT (NUDIX family)